MKTTGEIALGVLQKASDAMPDTVNEQGKRTLTPSDGSGTGVMIAPGKTRPQPDEVRDILWKLSTIKLWQIKPEDQKDVKNALSALAWATIPATIDEAVYWLTRLIAHFPRRDATKDAVVISDLAADMFDAEVSLVALVATCDEIRKGATAKNPWFPPSGEILALASEKTKGYHTAKKRLEAPPRPSLAPPAPKEQPPSPWSGYAWDDMPEGARVALWDFLKFLDRSIRLTYCRVIQVDYDVIENFFNQAGKVEHDSKTEEPGSPVCEHSTAPTAEEA